MTVLRTTWNNNCIPSYEIKRKFFPVNIRTSNVWKEWFEKWSMTMTVMIIINRENYLFFDTSHLTKQSESFFFVVEKICFRREKKKRQKQYAFLRGFSKTASRPTVAVTSSSPSSPWPPSSSHHRAGRNLTSRKRKTARRRPTDRRGRRDRPPSAGRRRAERRRRRRRRVRTRDAMSRSSPDVGDRTTTTITNTATTTTTTATTTAAAAAATAAQLEDPDRTPLGAGEHVSSRLTAGMARAALRRESVLRTAQGRTTRRVSRPSAPLGETVWRRGVNTNGTHFRPSARRAGRKRLNVGPVPPFPPLSFYSSVFLCFPPFVFGRFAFRFRARNLTENVSPVCSDGAFIALFLGDGCNKKKKKPDETMVRSRETISPPGRMLPFYLHSSYNTRQNLRRRPNHIWLYSREIIRI